MATTPVKLGAERMLAAASLLRRAGREVECLVVGHSMGSTLPHGSRVKLRFADPDTVAIGDVVAILLGRKIVVHRLVHRSGRGRTALMLTIGDAEIVPDPLVEGPLLLGPVVQVRSGEHWKALDEAPRRAGVSGRCARALVNVSISLAGRHPRLGAALGRALAFARALLRRRYPTALDLDPGSLDAGAEPPIPHSEAPRPPA